MAAGYDRTQLLRNGKLCKNYVPGRQHLLNIYAREHVSNKPKYAIAFNMHNGHWFRARKSVRLYRENILALRQYFFSFFFSSQYKVAREADYNWIPVAERPDNQSKVVFAERYFNACESFDVVIQMLRKVNCCTFYGHLFFLFDWKWIHYINCVTLL